MSGQTPSAPGAPAADTRSGHRVRRLLGLGVPTALIVVSLVLTHVLGISGTSATASMQGARGALTANAFVSSIGVNTHAGYLDRSYGDFPVWRDRLVEAGIRNIRDGVAVGQWPVYDRLNELASKGIKTDLQLGRPFYGHSGALVGDPFAPVNNPAGTLDELLGVLKTHLLGAVGSVEGPNEYDLSGDPEWAATLRTYQTRMFQALQADPRTADLPVLAPSLTSHGARTRLGQVPADLGNLHNYTGGEQETSSHVDSELGQAAKVAGDRPAWSTESNPNTAVGNVGNQPGVSDRAQAIYTLRQYLEDWRKGIRRTYIYELMDELPQPGVAEMSWGILRSDGTPKPAYTALKNMISLLDDRGPAFTPGGLTPTLSGTTSATRSTLLQKRDGSYYLALWQEKSVYDILAHRDLPIGGTAVTITVPTRSTFTTYVPNDGSQPTNRTEGTTRYRVTSSAKVTFVKISG